MSTNTSPSYPTTPHPGSNAWGAVYDADSLLDHFRRALRPVDRLSVWEWADQKRMLPPTSAEPGRWRTDRTPYLKEIMEVLSPLNPTEFIVFMKGAQIGATEVGLNWIGHMIDLNPGLMLGVQPGLSEVKRNTNTRINPLIDQTPALKERVVEAASREAGNSMFRKAFPGGELVLTGANSAKGLRSTPARDLFLDEVDGYPLDADGEGDPVDLAVQRTVTFMGRRKIYMCSTPTVDGISRIQKAYEESDQRRYYLQCLECGEWDYLVWERIQWEEDAGPDSAGYVCAACGHKHMEYDKPALLKGGEWRATAPGPGKPAGFHLSALYSPFEPWSAIVTDFLNRKKDPNRLKVWVNTKLGETWKEKGDAPEWEYLYALREHYRVGTVPQGGVVLTAGVDVQADRLECEVVAWGPFNESWSVTYEVLEGRTGDIEDICWRGLDELLGSYFDHAGGTALQIRCMAVDEGYNTHTVRDWARRYDGRRVIVIKGQDSAAAPLGLPSSVDVNSRGRRLRRGMRVWPVGVSHLKSELYAWLRLTPPTAEGEDYPQGYCHFPQYDDEYFKMLTGEQLMKRTVRGYPRWEWMKTRERNEALDCRIYARAAYLRLGVHRWSQLRWEQEIENLTARPAAPLTPTTAARPKRKVRGRSSYLER